MPTYMYKCQDCGHRFEQVQGFHDDPLEVCPDCGGTTRRVIGNVGVTFKGSGFYRTDSRASAKKPTGAKDTAAKDKAKSAGTKSDSPATAKPKGTSSGSGSSSTSP